LLLPHQRCWVVFGPKLIFCWISTVSLMEPMWKFINKNSLK
jgi:hypothetical protein